MEALDNEAQILAKERPKETIEIETEKINTTSIKLYCKGKVYCLYCFFVSFRSGLLRGHVMLALLLVF